MVQTDLSKYDNSWFHIGARRLKVVVWYFINVFFLNCSWNPSSGLKVRLLRIFGENVWIDNLVQVTIGSNVCISQGAMLLCGNHNYKLPTFDLIVKPIVIENGAWVGAKSTVCPGVTMSSHSVLSVGSVASKDLASYSVYRGNPATFVTKRIISES